MAMANTVAYYNMAAIVTVKKLECRVQGSIP
jgi:hypothetical protein